MTMFIEKIAGDLGRQAAMAAVQGARQSEGADAEDGGMRS